MIFAFYSVVIERTASEFGLQRAEKARQKTDSGDELERRAFFDAERKFRRKYTVEEAGGRS